MSALILVALIVACLVLAAVSARARLGPGSARDVVAYTTSVGVLIAVFLGAVWLLQ